MSEYRNRPSRGVFASAATPPIDNYLAEVLRGLGAPPSNNSSELGSAANFLRSSPSPAGLGSGSLFAKAPQSPSISEVVSALLGNTPLPPAPFPGSIFGRAAPTATTAAALAPQVRRKVFFSFHFEEDIRRSCIVRNSYRFRPGHKLPTANFYDRSLWERSKLQGEEALKRLIREGMDGSSVTCVLAGSQTWSRPWVRYEIARSLISNNGLFTVHIHGVKDALKGVVPAGPNPLDFMGLELRPDGRGNICELTSQGWALFGMLARPVMWPVWLMKPDVNFVRPLSYSARSYDYCLDGGYDGLAGWAQTAAHAARGR